MFSRNEEIGEPHQYANVVFQIMSQMVDLAFVNHQGVHVVRNLLVTLVWTQLSINLLVKPYRRVYGYVKITLLVYRHSFLCFQVSRFLQSKLGNLSKPSTGINYREISFHWEHESLFSWQWKPLSHSRISNSNDRKAVSLKLIMKCKKSEKSQWESTMQIWTIEIANFFRYIQRKM